MKTFNGLVFKVGGQHNITRRSDKSQFTRYMAQGINNYFLEAPFESTHKITHFHNKHLPYIPVIEIAMKG